MKRALPIAELFAGICCIAAEIGLIFSPMARWEQFIWPLITLMLFCTVSKYRRAGILRADLHHRAETLLDHLAWLLDDEAPGAAQPPRKPQV